MRKMRILVLVHERLVPPESLDGVSEREIALWRDVWDVMTALRDLGHEVRLLGLLDELAPLQQALLDWRPHLAFNLLEEFSGVAGYDAHVAAYLELMRQPYTGCNPRGLLLTRDKALSKTVLAHHGIDTPRFDLVPLGQAAPRRRDLRFPLLIKSATEDASAGISRSSVIRTPARLEERVAFVHESLGSDALVEEYVEGRELYVGVLGNERLTTLPIWEMVFGHLPDDGPRIATSRVKWDPAYRRRWGITTRRARRLGASLERRIASLCREAYRRLGMSGYGRMDLRLDAEGRLWFLEANGNPNLEEDEDLAASARAAGVPYPSLLQRIVGLGLRYEAPWRAWSEERAS